MPIPPSEATPSPSPDAKAAPAAIGSASVGHERFAPLAGLLAMVLPGAGHFFLGERARAGLIAAGVLGLMASGLLIGGIDAIDSREDTIWFAGQALIGPIPFAIDYYHQNHLKVLYTPGGGERSPRGVRTSRGLWLRSPDPGEVRDPASGLVTARDPSKHRAAYTKSLGRMNELGTLFITIAGMLNLIAIIDAFSPGHPAGGRR